ncbi:MAG: 1-phosphofructokinase family hexose kinase [Anaerolineaceae bacterium]|jgi:1-phosphofructokinase family hexose kinase|nr:1-phosphofructokinase family hexose kinase [Chloroflexota bacterium]
MIITLTPNPSVERTMLVDRIKFNEILRAAPAQLEWSGKGINVSRGLRMFRQNSLAIAWVGGGAGKMLEDGLEKLGIQTDFVWVDGETRTNTVLREEDNDWYMLVNEHGPFIPPEAIDEMFAKVERYPSPGDIWVVGGSLPPGVPEDFYATLIRMLKARGVHVIFDATGPCFKPGIEENPWLLYLEITEAERLMGYEIRTFDIAKRAAMGFLSKGVEYLALVLETGGTLVASRDLMVATIPPKVPSLRVTGLRGAFMAGLADGFAKKLPLVEIARRASATRVAYVSHQDYSVIQKEEFMELLAQVEVRSIPLV